MATHTPGPLFVEDWQDFGAKGFPWVVAEPQRQDDNMKAIALCEKREDAMLYAAAPELLAALKALSAWHDHSALTGLPDGAPVADWAPSFDETVNMVHAAIAKAEGK